MVPIHDTDLTELRGAKAFEGEWAQYELWERVELRLKRRRNLWILGAIVCFLLISSVPVFMDHWPKWTAMRLSRKLADQVNFLKRQAAIEHRAYRIHFESGLNYVISHADSCLAMKSQAGTQVRAGVLDEKVPNGEFAVVTPDQGKSLGVPGLVADFCYDQLLGSQADEPGTKSGEELVGFGIIPVKDLTEGRTDRLSALLLKGPSAEISLE